MSYCTNCGKQVEENDKFCIECKQNNLSQKNVSIKYSTNQNTQKRKNKDAITSSIAIIISLAIVVVIFMIILNLTDPTSKFDVLKSCMNNEQIKVASEIIKKCGLEKGKITRDELLDDAYSKGCLGYRIEKNGIKTVMYIKDGEIVTIEYADKILYKNGKYPEKLSDYVITSDEKSTLIEKCKQTLNSILKSPSTAKYPWNYDEWKMQKNKNTIIIQSYVDAQNSFGATIRSEFQFKIKDGEIVSLIFDGKEYM